MEQGELQFYQKITEQTLVGDEGRVFQARTTTAKVLRQEFGQPGGSEAGRALIEEMVVGEEAARRPDCAGS